MKFALAKVTAVKHVAPEHTVGMDLDEPFLTALELFNEKRATS